MPDGDNFPNFVARDEAQLSTLREHGFEGVEFMEVIRQHFATELSYYRETLAIGHSGLAEQAIPKPRKAFIPKEQPEILVELLHVLYREEEAKLLHRFFRRQ